MSGLFGRPDPMPAPAVKPPAPIPDQNDAASREAARRAQMDIMGRAGRSSTILTAPEKRGGDYSATRLGTAA